MIATCARVIRDERGQGLVEYAIILALIAVVCFAGLHQLGSGTRGIYGNIATSITPIGN